jgi:hypothetical protein
MLNGLLNFFSTKAMGCRTYSDLEYFYSTTAPCPTFKIPDDIGNLQDAGFFAVKKYRPSYSERLASICYNKNMVVLVSNHCVSDGGYFQWLNSFLVGDPVQPDPHFLLPISASVAFRDQIKAPPNPVPCKTSFLKTNSFTQSLEKAPYRFKPFEIPLNSIPSFKNGKVSGMTEILWNSMSLVASASKGKFENSSVATCFDMRKIFKANWNHCDMFSVFVVEGRNVHSGMSVGELSSKMRADFKEKLAKQAYFDIFKQTEFPSNSEVGVEISSVGVLKTGGVVEDIYASLHLNNSAGDAGTLQITAFTVNGELRARVRFPPAHVSDGEGEQLAAAARHVITHVRPEMIVGDVTDELRRLFFM